MPMESREVIDMNVKDEPAGDKPADESLDLNAAGEILIDLNAAAAHYHKLAGTKANVPMMARACQFGFNGVKLETYPCRRDPRALWTTREAVERLVQATGVVAPVRSAFPQSISAQ